MNSIKLWFPDQTTFDDLRLTEEMVDDFAISIDSGIENGKVFIILALNCVLGPLFAFCRANQIRVEKELTR